MAGKAPVTCSKPLYYAMDMLTKNQLIDLVVDMNRKLHGEEAGDDVLVAAIQSDMAPVWRMRGDKPVSLAGRYQHVINASDEYRRRNGLN